MIMAPLRRIFALMRKEFLSLLKDKRSRMVIIVPPIVQLLVFGYAATFDLERVPFAVYNEDRTAAARELVARFDSSPNFEQVAQVHSDAEIAPLVDAQQVLLVLNLGPEFSRDLHGGGASVQMIVDGRDSNTSMLVLNYARVIVRQFNAEWAERAGLPATARIAVRSWFNPNLQSRWFMVPGIVALLTLVVTLLVTALSVAREREQGTFDQLLVTPFHPYEILAGKSLPGFVIGLLEASFIIAVASLWFEVPLQGSLLTLYAGLTLFLLSAIGVGLMISSLAVTQQQGLLGAFLFLVPAIILSGFTTPIANMPQIVQDLTLLNPMRYFEIILRTVFLEGATLEQVAGQLWPMALIGTVSLSLAAWLFRRRLY